VLDFEFENIPSLSKMRPYGLRNHQLFTISKSQSKFSGMFRGDPIHGQKVLNLNTNIPMDHCTRVEYSLVIKLERLKNALF